jgi:Fe2+ transport system protein FeoA
VELGAEELDIRWEGLRRRAEGGLVAADLIISVGGAAVKYNVYLRNNTIVLEFRSTNQSRVELATRLLRMAGVSAEITKVDDRDIWYVFAYTDKLAAGREELRKTIAEIVRKAVEKGWMDAGKAGGWLEKLEKSLTLKEGWPKYHVGLDKGALVVRFASTDRNSIEQEAQRLREMGLEEGKHFTVKMSEEGREGYVLILREGLVYAAWLSVNGSGEQQRLADEFVKLILQRAEEEGDAVYEKVGKIIEEGKARGSLKLEDFEGVVEVNGKRYVVKVKGGEAVEEDRGGRKLLRIRITAEVSRVEGEHTIVDRMVREYTITYSRRRADNATAGYAYASVDAPGGREADAERFSALIKFLTGKEPRVYRKSDGTIELVFDREHLDGFARFTELADAIKKWLEETS